MSKVALITGINGQDGSYLAELLLEKGYSVHGVKRRSSTKTHQRIEHLLDHSAGFDRGGRVTLHHGDAPYRKSGGRGKSGLHRIRMPGNARRGQP